MFKGKKMTDISIKDVFTNVFGSEKETTFDQVKDKAKLDRSKSDKAQETPLEKLKGVKIHVTKEYVKEHGTTIVGTKGDDIFIVDADVKKFDIKGNGGKDKVVIKKPLPEISFPKLPNE